MAKMNDYMAGRQGGLQLALTIVEKNGVDGLRDEKMTRVVHSIQEMMKNHIQAMDFLLMPGCHYRIHTGRCRK